MRDQPANVLAPLLAGSGGDVLVARDCAIQLLHGRRDPPNILAAARLILTAVCLHLYPIRGPDPTLQDLQVFLLRLAAPEPAAWEGLVLSSLALVQYAAVEFDGGVSQAHRTALSAAIEAVSHVGTYFP